MQQRVEEVSRTNDKILATLTSKGPCLPVQIAREIGFSPMFASAFLSELKAGDKVKLSNMRVGSSPLYYLPGQENLLEKFSGYLNQREKEAFFLLKEKRVLSDNEQPPVMRVALRAIKDFAHPVKIRAGSESKLYWRYFELAEEEVVRFVREGAPTVSVKPKEVEKKKEEVRNEKGPRAEVEKALMEEERPLAEIRKRKVEQSEFVISVKDYLSAKEIEVLEVISEKKREFEAKVRIDTLLGKQEFYLVAKEKKSVNENDFAMALQKAQGKKMPALVMATGEMNKKGREHFEEWGNLVKWEKLSF